MKTSQINYSDRDYQVLFSALKEKITYYLSEWTDHNDSDFGIALLQLLSYAADILHYYLDRMANEAYLPTVSQRENLINLLKLIDYELSSAVPATVDLTFTLGQAYTADVTIPAGTECQSVTDKSVDETIYFETNSDMVLPSGTADAYEENQLHDADGEFTEDVVGWTVKNLVTEESAEVTSFVDSGQLSFDTDLFPNGDEGYGFISGKVSATEGRNGSESMGNSDGSAYQQFAINTTPIIDGTLKVFVDGVEWAEKDSLALSEHDAEEYYIQRDADEKITVFFGDDSQGKIPANEAEITTEYRIGGGARGNLGPNTINIINSTILHQGSPISVDVTNAGSSSGGADRETAEHAKLQAPRELRTLNRCVTQDDYESLALGFTGVARAKVDPSEPLSYRKVDLYIIPEGGGLPSQSLKDDLAAFLEDKRMINDMLEVKDPEYVTVNMEITIFYLKTYVASTVEQAVSYALDDFFNYASTHIDFGRGIYLSDLYRLIDAIEGVDHVDIDKIYRVVVVEYKIWESDASFSEIVISSTTKEETWTVVFIDAAHFQVSGSISGAQINTGEIDIEYVSDNGEVTFTVNSGTIPVEIGDKASFKVSRLTSNLTLSKSEFPQKGTFNLTLSEVS